MAQNLCLAVKLNVLSSTKPYQPKVETVTRKENEKRLS